MEKVVCRASARVPIVKFWDPELQLACDMNLNNPLALENTRMIKTYVQIDDRVRPLAKIIKHWTKRRLLNDAGSFSISIILPPARTLTYVKLSEAPSVRTPGSAWSSTFFNRASHLYCLLFRRHLILKDQSSTGRLPNLRTIWIRFEDLVRPTRKPLGSYSSISSASMDTKSITRSLLCQ